MIKALVGEFSEMYEASELYLQGKGHFMLLETRTLSLQCDKEVTRHSDTCSRSTEMSQRW